MKNLLSARAEVLVRVKLFAAALAFTAAAASPAYAFELSDGTYVGSFPKNQCGTLTVSGDGGKIRYAYGPCGGAATYKHGGSFDGKTISIQAAKLKLSGASSSKISGRWTLGDYAANLSFKRK